MIAGHLAERARNRERELVWLETWEEQVEFLDKTSVDLLVKAIRESSKIPAELDEIRASVRSGNQAFFAGSIRGADDPLVARIERWIPKIERPLSSGKRTFIALGIGSLLGPHGLIAKLENRGYKVERWSKAIPTATPSTSATSRPTTEEPSP